MSNILLTSPPLSPPKQHFPKQFKDQGFAHHDTQTHTQSRVRRQSHQIKNEQNVNLKIPASFESTSYVFNAYLLTILNMRIKNVLQVFY